MARRSLRSHFFKRGMGFFLWYSFKDEGQNLEVVLKEKGEMILKLKSRKVPLNRSSRITFHIFSIKNRIVMRGFVEGWAPKIGETTWESDAALELGNHGISKKLVELNLGKRAWSGM